MNTFSISRFTNFSKYDIIINKAFYRNMGLTTIFGSLGIATIGFLGRWNTYSDLSEVTEIDGMNVADNPLLLGMANPEGVSMTVNCIIAFCASMLFIFVGHTFHNLRSKQGRITELTIPATNFERWAWHILAAVSGAIIACVLSVVCADALNAILNLVVYGGKFSSSITLEFFRTLFLLPDTNGGDMMAMSGSVPAILEETHNQNYARFLIACTLFSQLSIYIFGNSVKYRYNIILTYIALQVIGTVLLICGIIIAHNVNFDMNIKFDDDLGKLIYYGFCGINLLIGSICLWGSYRMYCKAQITSWLNK